MLFAPHIKRKKGGNNKCQVQPFPKCNEYNEYEGIFTGISVEICSKEDIIQLYDNGFYGKGTQSRSTPQVVIQSATKTKDATKTSEAGVEETLSLGLEEAFFLAYYLKILKIQNMSNIQMEWQDFLRESLLINETFLESLASYLHLKSKGWVVKSGLKFGGNFLIYRKGPRFYHASFVVKITTPSETEHMTSKNLKGFQRIAETSDKDVLLLEVSKPKEFHMLTLDDISRLQISETIIRRFNCTTFVQTQRTTK